MLKAPREGEVKTRLGGEIGAAAATTAFRNLVEHQIRQVPAGWPIHIYYSPADASAEMSNWLGAKHQYFPQTGGDLGQRLTAAVAKYFTSHAEPLLVLGGDCPYLETTVLQQAAHALAETDVVLTPAADGGYCLIGLHTAESRLFEEVTWSSKSVLLETRERLRERGLSWIELATLEDVDDAASWARARNTYSSLDPNV